MTKNDRIIGLVIVAIGALMLFQTYILDYPVFLDDPGPKLMPQVIAILLVLCGIGLLAWPKKRVDSEEVTTEKNKKGTILMAIIGASLICYVILLNWLGFIISTFVFLAFVIWILSEVRNKMTIVKSGLVSIVVTMSIYLIFVEALGILLPRFLG
ncbi:tripartite tricarboxylate transporter TctB family protein [Sporosarcina luteola]|uniref:tripartite tricarboxylate transporter TctB family protein n=1 Tax=Sporosarcina luteola TaxID=582850 RepID=UPI00203FCE41|nr:tripartite tricarboxylate transporter TctB family protein [Sporosarcina luteola]MCM3709140.1 tripartite tricarboxylate transporter TctB family protein [Sporosarcina luteola]